MRLGLFVCLSALFPFTQATFAKVSSPEQLTAVVAANATRSLYVPRTRSEYLESLEDLADLARVPFGIETWRDDPAPPGTVRTPMDQALSYGGKSLGDLMTTLSARVGGHDWRVSDGYVLVAPSIGVSSFLETQVDEFEVDGSIADALGKIHRLFDPDRPAERVVLSGVSVSGGDPSRITGLPVLSGTNPHVSISLRHTSLRSVLTALSAAVGRSSWFVVENTGVGKYSGCDIGIRLPGGRRIISHARIVK